MNRDNYKFTYSRFIIAPLMTVIIYLYIYTRTPDDILEGLYSIIYLGSIIGFWASFIFFQFVAENLIFGDLENIRYSTIKIYHREIIRLIGVVISVLFISFSVILGFGDRLDITRTNTIFFFILFIYVIFNLICTVLQNIKSELENNNRPVDKLKNKIVIEHPINVE